MVRRYGTLMGGMLAAVLFLAVGVLSADEETAEGQAGEQAKEEAKVELPAAVADALKAAFPKAKVEEVKVEQEEGLALYEVELKQDTVEMEVEVAPDGTLVEIETAVAQEAVPAAALQALQAADPAAKIDELKKIEIRAEIKKAEEEKPAELVKLATPKIVYEAELKKEGKEGEITVAADGKVVEALKWEEEEKEKGEKEEGGEQKEAAPAPAEAPKAE